MKRNPVKPNKSIAIKPSETIKLKPSIEKEKLDHMSLLVSKFLGTYFKKL